MAYDERVYAGFHRVYDIIISGMYFRKCDRRLKIYIKYCPDCQLLQISRHASYGVLYLIIGLFISFYTILADFVLALPRTKDGMDYFLISYISSLRKSNLSPKRRFIQLQIGLRYFSPLLLIGESLRIHQRQGFEMDVRILDAAFH